MISKIYLSDFSVLSSSDNNTNASSRSDVGARKEKVGLVLVDGAEVIDDFSLFLNGNGLASKKSLIDSHRGRVDLNDADVSWDLVTDSDFDDITGDDFSGEDALDLLSVRSEDLGHFRFVFFKRFDCRLGVLFLPDSDNSVRDENEEDDKRLDKGGDAFVVLAALFEERENEGNAGGEEEDSDEEIFELLDDQLHQRLAFFGRKLVQAISLLVIGDLKIF